MTMFTQTIELGRDKALGLWKKLMIFICCMMGLIVIMWVFNIADLRGINLFLYFVGVLTLLGIYLSPRAFYIALGAGAVTAELNDQDWSQGAVKGLSGLYNVGLWSIFCFCVMAGGLATWSFAYAPAAFWIFAAASTTIVVTMLAFKIKGTWLPWIVLIYSLMVIGFALMSTITGRTVDPQQAMANTYNGVTPADSPEVQKQKLDRVKQDADLAATQKVVETEANAKAAESARLAQEVAKNLPTAVIVPLCKDGMSKPVIIPAHWGVMAAWGVGSTPFDILKNGEWKRATTINNEGIEAVRYCTKTKANADLGSMSLSWYAN